MCCDIFKFIRTPFSQTQSHFTISAPCTLVTFALTQGSRTLPLAFCLRSIYDVAKIYKLLRYRFSSSRTELVSNPRKTGTALYICLIGVNISHSAAVPCPVTAVAKPGKT